MRERSRYCFWSLATKPYAGLMQACVDSARASGVFADFNILAEVPLARCTTYDLRDFRKHDGLFPIFYLKRRMEVLNYDYFVWLDADSRFFSPPIDVLAPLRHSPIHVPFAEPLPDDQVAQRYRQARLSPPFFRCSTPFWMVHHDFISPLYELARDYLQSTRTEIFSASLAESLGFAAHLLVADYQDHLQDSYGNTWRDVSGYYPSGRTILDESPSDSPSIVHLRSGHELRL